MIGRRNVRPSLYEGSVRGKVGTWCITGMMLFEAPYSVNTQVSIRMGIVDLKLSSVGLTPRGRLINRVEKSPFDEERSRSFILLAMANL